MKKNNLKIISNITGIIIGFILAQTITKIKHEIKDINLKTFLEFIEINRELTFATFATIILSIIIIIKIIEECKIRTTYNNTINYIAGITSTSIVFNVKLPGTDNIIDMITIHPTGIYLINYIKYEGHIRGTLMMDYWEVDTPDGKTHQIKNSVKEMKENESIAKTMLPEKIYPVIIFKNKTICYVLDGWINENLMMIKEYEQEKIFENKEYIISYIRREDIFENMKQFQSKKRKWYNNIDNQNE